MTKPIDFWKKLNWPLSAVLSLGSVLGLLYYGLRLRESLLSVTNSILSVLLFAGFMWIFHRALRLVDGRLYGFSLCGGLLLSGMLVFGSELFVWDHVSLFNWKQWTGILFVGFLFAAMLVCLFSSLPRAQKKLCGCTRPHLLENVFNGGWRYFLIVWGILFVCWIPALLAGYPGIYGYDSAVQVTYLAPGSQLNAHHPILHTLYLYGSLRLGELCFGSTQAGMLIYALTQMLALSAAFAYACRFLAKRKAGIWWQVGLIAYFALWPINAILSISSTKDVLFSAIFLLLVLFTWDMAKQPDTFFHSWPRIFRYVLTVFFMCAMRNNGIYVLIVAIPFILILLRRYWKRAACVCAACLLLYGVYTGPVYTLLNVRDGSIREALSVPLQQLARVAYYAKDQLTEEEYAQICEIIPEERLSSYTSRIADPIKNHLRADVFEENPGRYIKLWIKLGLKFPGVYIDSFLSNNFGFWYPDMAFPDPPAWHPYLEFKNAVTPTFKVVKMETKSPALLKFYQDIAYNTVHQKIPVVSMLFSPGFSFWLLFIYLLAVLYFKKYRLLLPGLYLFLLWGTLLLGPVVLLRYVYPLMITTPCLWILSLHEESWEKPEKRGKREKRLPTGPAISPEAGA